MTPRDHGGGLDAAVARYGGARADWLDLSTGINPVPYPVGEIPQQAWSALPDHAAMERLLTAARTFWNVPDAAQIVAAPGASAIIASMPRMRGFDLVYIPGPTYNEHAAAFDMHDWEVLTRPSSYNSAQVFVHPNNPDGRLAEPVVSDRMNWTIIDESFCDTRPEDSLIAHTANPGWMVIKGFGKFWGLAGLRLGLAVGHPDTLRHTETTVVEVGRGRRKRPMTSTFEYPSLSDLLGPWAVSGPALEIGTRALSDIDWAIAARARLAQDAARLDELLTGHGASVVGGTTLFRLYEVDDAAAWQERLARHRIWSRTFPYSSTWLRLGLPAPDRWTQLEAAL